MSDAFQTFQALASRKFQADYQATEAKARAQLSEKVADAMAVADERDHLVGWDCFADETIVDWQALAEVAVKVFAEFLRDPPSLGEL